MHVYLTKMFLRFFIDTPSLNKFIITFLLLNYISTLNEIRQKAMICSEDSKMSKEYTVDIFLSLKL